MKQPGEWSRLDNAAKIFPPTATQEDTKVFRFVCELREPVRASLLQAAVEETVKSFPLYRSVLKKGLFWYYFEDSDKKPVVARETKPPCSPLYYPDRPGLLFEVTYFGCRINLEVFHALADGTGALYFLQNLIAAYLKKRYPEQLGGVQLPEEGASREEQRMDAFYQYYDKKEGTAPPAGGRAYRIKGERLQQAGLCVTEGVLSTGAVLSKAHEAQATISEFLTALLMLSVSDHMAVRERSRPVVVTVPVDLRRFFPAQTARNFFGVIKVGCRFGKKEDRLEQVIKACRKSFREQLTTENMLGIINRYSAIENNPLVKGVPLALKIPCLKLAGLWADREDTVALSNVGRVLMPEEMKAHIRLFSVFLSTKRPQLCLCSFGDTMTMSFSSPLRSTEVQRSFFSRLAAMGLSVEVASNLAGEEEPYGVL